MLQNTKVFYFLVLLIILSIGIWLFLPLTVHGVGTAFDSISYLSTAENLVKGRGWQNFDGRAYSNWPPLYPLLLTPIYLFFKGEVLSAGVLFNAIGYFLTAFLLFKILYTLFNKRFVTLFGLFVSLGSVFSLVSFHNIISETYYIVFTLLYIVILYQYITSANTKYFIFLVVAAWLCSLQRYVGVVPIGVGCISLFLVSNQTLVARLWRVILYGFLAVLPLLLWLIKNIIDTETVTGADRTMEVKHVKYNLVNLIQQVWQWFWPYYEKSGFVYFAVLGLFFFVGAVVALWRKEKKAFSPYKLMLIILFTHSTIYMVFMTVAAIMQSSSAIDARLSSPAYFTAVPIFCFMLHKWNSKAAKLKGKILIYLFACFTLFHSFKKSYSSWVEALTHGEGVTDLRWRTSEMMNFLRTNEGKAILSSNSLYCSPPEPLYFYGFGSIRNVVQEHKRGVLHEVFKNDPSTKIVIWFDTLDVFDTFLRSNNYFYPYKVIESFEDGYIIQVEGSKGS